MIRSRKFDLCVIGAGPAGALVAATIAADGHDVVILDAGPRFDRQAASTRMEHGLRTTPRTEIWGMGGSRDVFSISGDAQYALNDRRVKGIGGSTLHWGGTVPRMHPEDFEMERRHGIFEDWPISYDDLEPYYVNAEHALGAAGAPSPFGGHRSAPYPLPPHPFSYSDRIFEQACNSLDITLHNLPHAINSASFDGRGRCAGYGTCNPVCPSGAKYSADVHIRKAEDQGAVVVAEAPVQSLLHNESGERVSEAVYIQDGEEHTISADVFVVACGAVETPRLLLLSRSERYPDGLANTSGLVGRRFMEHVAIRVQARLDAPTRQHLIGFGTSHSEQFYGYNDGPKGSILLTPINTAGPSPLHVALSPRSNLATMMAGGVPGGTGWGDDFLEHARERTHGYLGIAAGTELEPNPAHRVTLDDSTTDDHGNPAPEIAFGVDDHAREILARAEQVLLDIMDATGAYEIETTFGPREAYFANHQTGTTRMGTDPNESVVNPTLRTHDLENLYIAGGSTFVTGGPANPTLTIAAISLMLADHLSDRLAGRAG